MYAIFYLLQDGVFCFFKCFFLPVPALNVTQKAVIQKDHRPGNSAGDLFGMVSSRDPLKRLQR